MTRQNLSNMSLFEHFIKLWAFIWRIGSGSGSASELQAGSDPHKSTSRIQRDADPQHCETFILVLGRAEGWLEVMYDRDKVPYSQFLAMLRHVTFSFFKVPYRNTCSWNAWNNGWEGNAQYEFIINALPNMLSDTTLIRRRPGFSSIAAVRVIRNQNFLVRTRIEILVVILRTTVCTYHIPYSTAVP